MGDGQRYGQRGNNRVSQTRLSSLYCGNAKVHVKQYERALLKDDWRQVHDGLEVKTCASPDGNEAFILCRSEDRRCKEKAIHQRFKGHLEEGLKQIEQGCFLRRHKLVTVAKRVGRLLGRYSRAAGLFKTDVIQDADGRARLVWEKVEAWRDWAACSEDCYLLRTNITDWSGEDLWRAYMQLTRHGGLMLRFASIRVTYRFALSGISVKIV